MCRVVARNDGAAVLIRLLFALMVLAQGIIPLTGCGPSYSPNTYASNAAQQANKVDEGVIVGVRPVHISASGVVGGVAGAAAGGVAGSQVGVGTTSAFSAIGGSVIGGIAGVTAEHIVGDTNGFEYVVRKPNGDMISVTQKDEKALPVGQKVLVIGGAQARIVPDYTVPFDAPKVTAKPASEPPAAEASPRQPPADAPSTQAPATIVSPTQIPAAPGGPPSPPASGAAASQVPGILVPSAPASAEPKP
jgi:outer membrane lipoprotein SlyB